MWLSSDGRLNESFFQRRANDATTSVNMGAARAHTHTHLSNWEVSEFVCLSSFFLCLAIGNLELTAHTRTHTHKTRAKLTACELTNCSFCCSRARAVCLKAWGCSIKTEQMREREREAQVSAKKENEFYFILYETTTTTRRLVGAQKGHQRHNQQVVLKSARAQGYFASYAWRAWCVVLFCL